MSLLAAREATVLVTKGFGPVGVLKKLSERRIRARISVGRRVRPEFFRPVDRGVISCGPLPSSFCLGLNLLVILVVASEHVCGIPPVRKFVGESNVLDA